MKKEIKNIRKYHYQASTDNYAKQTDNYTGYTTASMKQIRESYKEFMDDLMLESQEAY